MAKSDPKQVSKPKIIHFDESKTKPAQEILDLFEVVLSEQLQSETLVEQVGEIKRLLYERDYLGAFQNPERNKYYIARWSLSRSLAYASIFAYLKEVYELIGTVLDGQSQVDCLSIGAGAGGEFIGLAAVFCRMMESSSNFNKKQLLVDIVDISNWNVGLLEIYTYIQTNWLVKDQQLALTYSYMEKDILTMSDVELQLSKRHLITLLFTTNELFQQNKVASIELLHKLNRNCHSGCYLLIIESAGSFSHIEIGKSGKKFPIQFLIDMILCGNKEPNTNNSDGPWQMIRSDDSCWFRVDKHLHYPLKLENMRFFYRLYRKT